jgi:hypothetical protein
VATLERDHGDSVAPPAPRRLSGVVAAGVPPMKHGAPVNADVELDLLTPRRAMRS